MRIDQYFVLDSAIQRNRDLVELCDRIQYQQGLNRKRVMAIRKRAKGLLEELTTLKDEVDQKLARPEPSIPAPLP